MNNLIKYGNITPMTIEYISCLKQLIKARENWKIDENPVTATEYQEARKKILNEYPDTAVGQILVKDLKVKASVKKMLDKQIVG